MKARYRQNWILFQHRVFIAVTLFYAYKKKKMVVITSHGFKYT